MPAAPSYEMPKALADLTPDLLQAAISSRHPGPSVAGVEMLEVRRRREFIVSTASRVRLRLAYGSGSPPLPRQAIVKLSIAEDGAAVPELYETEVNMYKRMVPDPDIVKPCVLAADHDPASGRFLLVPEDLSVRQACFQDAPKPPPSTDQVGRLLDQLGA